MFRNRLLQNGIVALLVCSMSAEVSINAMPVSESVAQDSAAQDSAAELSKVIKEQLGDGLNEREIIAAEVVSQEFTRQISNVEWLAPLAPIALSPFFGITLLSGLACFGPEWLPDRAMLSEGSPLANPYIFWAFLVLTVITSIPRFSKVSKPVAQVADFLETYSAIVILLTLKIMSMDYFQPDPGEVSMVQAGILSASWEGLLMVAMVVNIIVVNSVKFFFEILVWITPIPFLDACFETANKALCAGLMAIYAFSPILALIINISMFVVCALAFTWIRRREIFFRTILIDWIVQKLSKSNPAFKDILIVFPKDSVGSIPQERGVFWSRTSQAGN